MEIVQDRITAAAYHADHSRVSNSMLSVFRQSRQRYFRRFVECSVPAPEPTEAMQRGSLVHTLILEPDKASQYAVAPHCDRRTKDGKAAWAEFVASSDGKTVVDSSDFAEAKAIANAVHANSIAASLIQRAGDNEQSHAWEDPKSGLLCKCRYDRICHDMILDLKTSRDSSPRGFVSSVASLGYHRQAAHYRHGWMCTTGESLPFVFIVVCTEPPYDVGIYELDEDALQLGEAQNESALRQLASCHKNNDWREPWQKQITQLSLPKWTVYANEYEVIE